MTEALVTDNINLVYGVIHRYYPTFAQDEDLAQQGMIGLIYAAKSFEEGRGIAFSTFATKCIRNEIRKEFVRRCGQPKTVSFEGDEDSSLESILFTDGGLDDAERLQTFYEFSSSNLTDVERSILRMREKDWSNEEIGKVVGTTEAAIRKKMRKIKRMWEKWKNEAV